MPVDKNKKDVVSSTEITVSVYTDFMQIQFLFREWDDFVEKNGGDIFMTYDWCRIWWKYYGKGRDLKIFIFRNNEGLVGIMPVFLENIWLGPAFIRAVKIVGSDFTLSQFNLPICKRYISKTIGMFFDALSVYKWDVMHIGPIVGLCEHYDLLKKSFIENGEMFCRIRESNREVQTYFKLAKDWDSHLSTFSKNGRRSIKRNYDALYRSLEGKQGVLITQCAEGDDFQTAFADFAYMHQLHWQNLGKAGHFVDWPMSYEYHKEQAENQMLRGRLRMLVSKWGDYALGYEYAYKCGNRYYAFLNSRLEPNVLENVSLGIPMFCEQVKMAINENIEYIDAMRGKYEYKMRLGGTLFPIKSILAIPKKFFVTMRVNIFFTLARLINILYYKVWFRRIAPKLPLKQRPLWRLWIRTRL